MKALPPGSDQQKGFNPPGPIREGEIQQFSPSGFSHPSGNEQGGDVMRRYWRVIWRRRWEILGVFVAVLAISAIMAYRTKPVYTATGSIAIEPARQQVMIGVQDFTPSDQGSYEGQIIKTHLDILQSRALAERVVNKLRLGEYPEFAVAPGTTDEAKEKQRTLLINAFLRGLEVKKPTDPSGQRVIRVSYISTDARLSAEVLNTLFEAFINYQREANTQAVEFAQEWLTKQLAELESKVTKSKEDLLRYQEGADIITTAESEENPALKQLDKLYEQLAEAKAQRVNAELIYRNTRASSAEAVPELPNDPVLDGLKQERAKLEGELSQLRIIYQDDAPPVKQAEQKLAELDGRIKRTQEETQQTYLSRIAREYKAAENRVQALTDEVERQKEELQKQNREALQFSLLKRQSEVDERLFQMLSERLREAGLMRSLTPNTNIRVIDRAEIPLLPSNSRRAPLLRGALLGLMLGIGFAFFLEFLDDKVKSGEDIETLIRLPNLGHIPLSRVEGERPSRSGRQAGERKPQLLMTTENGNWAVVEAFRTLRTSVLLSSPMCPPRSIVITSYEAGAGKTTTAVNMAVAMAQAGKRVLLIDADLRHPCCAQTFGIDNTAGLSTYLSLNEATVPIHHDCVVAGLSILPSGPIPPNPSELLSSAKTQALMEAMVAQYDHIIIDTPPLGLVSDALIVSVLAEGVILIAKAGHASRRRLMRARDMLRSANIRILGVALNAVDPRRHQDGYYGYGYGYGYGHDYGHYYYRGEKAKSGKEEERKDEPVGEGEGRP
ncbi:MAG: polysaccharide biosynthesis tyrosine autokinase [Acidobacteria bacterium]|nr:polysaccharide biosynthesis tyrosine autokinase [Acidobacteriota bacterium]